MKALSTSAWMAGAIILVMAGCAARAADSQDCRFTPASRARWTSYLLRQMTETDAARLGRLVSDIINGQVEGVQAEISSGIDPNTPLTMGVDEMSFLTLAAAACQDEVARELVALGASVNGDGRFDTPLDLAAAKGRSDPAEFLLQHGAVVDRVDINGHTALADALRQHQIGVVLSVAQARCRSQSAGGRIFAASLAPARPRRSLARSLRIRRMQRSCADTVRSIDLASLAATRPRCRG